MATKSTWNYVRNIRNTLACPSQYVSSIDCLARRHPIAAIFAAKLIALRPDKQPLGAGEEEQFQMKAYVPHNI